MGLCCSVLIYFYVFFMYFLCIIVIVMMMMTVRCTNLFTIPPFDLSGCVLYSSAPSLGRILSAKLGDDTTFSSCNNKAGKYPSLPCLH